MIQKICAGLPGRKTKSRKGFTLAELLIVVAIVAVLVAIAIPVFTGALDEANKAVLNADARAARAQASVDYLLNNRKNTVYYDYTVQADGKIEVTVSSATSEKDPTQNSSTKVVTGTIAVKGEDLTPST